MGVTRQTPHLRLRGQEALVLRTKVLSRPPNRQRIWFLDSTNTILCTAGQITVPCEGSLTVPPCARATNRMGGKGGVVPATLGPG